MLMWKKAEVASPPIMFLSLARHGTRIAIHTLDWMPLKGRSRELQVEWELKLQGWCLCRVVSPCWEAGGGPNAIGPSLSIGNPTQKAVDVEDTSLRGFNLKGQNSHWVTTSHILLWRWETHESGFNGNFIQLAISGTKARKSSKTRAYV